MELPPKFPTLNHLSQDLVLPLLQQAMLPSGALLPWKESVAWLDSRRLKDHRPFSKQLPLCRCLLPEWVRAVRDAHLKDQGQLPEIKSLPPPFQLNKKRKSSRFMVSHLIGWPRSRLQIRLVPRPASTRPILAMHTVKARYHVASIIVVPRIISSGTFQ